MGLENGFSAFKNFEDGRVGVEEFDGFLETSSLMSKKLSSSNRERRAK